MLPPPSPACERWIARRAQGNLAKASLPRNGKWCCAHRRRASGCFCFLTLPLLLCIRSSAFFVPHDRSQTPCSPALLFFRFYAENLLRPDALLLIFRSVAHLVVRLLILQLSRSSAFLLPCSFSHTIFCSPGLLLESFAPLPFRSCAPPLLSLSFSTLLFFHSFCSSALCLCRSFVLPRFRSPALLHFEVLPFFSYPTLRLTCFFLLFHFLAHLLFCFFASLHFRSFCSVAHPLSCSPLCYPSVLTHRRSFVPQPGALLPIFRSFAHFAALSFFCSSCHSLALGIVPLPVFCLTFSDLLVFCFSALLLFHSFALALFCGPSLWLSLFSSTLPLFDSPALLLPCARSLLLFCSSALLLFLFFALPRCCSSDLLPQSLPIVPLSHYLFHSFAVLLLPFSPRSSLPPPVARVSFSFALPLLHPFAL